MVAWSLSRIVRKISGQESRTYAIQMAYQSILFYKPYNVLCQFTNPDQLDCQTLKDFIAIPEIYSVGRLDRDSEGLLLLTNHGPLKHRLTDPKFQHPRTYWVQVERIPDEAALEQLRRGVTIKGGYQTQPAQVRILDQEPPLPPREPPIRFRKSVPTAWLEMTLTEGKNRQVRRMTAAVGFPTLRLVRSALALTSSVSPETLTLQGLSPGEWRSLSPQEGTTLSQLLQTAPSRASGSSARPISDSDASSGLPSPRISPARRSGGRAGGQASGGRKSDAQKPIAKKKQGSPSRPKRKRNRP